MYKMNNQLMHEQDEHIEEIHQLASKMKKQGHEINRQLGRQDQLIKNLDEQFELTNRKLNGLQEKVAVLLETNDVNQICSCMMLCCMMIVLVILICIT